MPCVRSSLRTVSVGCAPRASQSRIRSSSSTIVEGLVWALYCPTVSITRPSRLERWSATTTRQIGFLRLPMRVSLSLTAMVQWPRLACASLPCLAHQRAEIGHPPLGDLPHHLAHL